MRYYPPMTKLPVPKAARAYMSARMSLVGRAGVGQCKIRGSSEYYAELARKAAKARKRNRKLRETSQNGT